MAVLQPLVEEYPDDYLPRLMVGKVLGQIGENVRAAAMLGARLYVWHRTSSGPYCLSMVLFAEAKEATRKGTALNVAEELFREVVETAGQALALRPDYGFAYMPLGLALKRLEQRSASLPPSGKPSTAIPNLPSCTSISASCSPRTANGAGRPKSNLNGSSR